MNVLFTGKASKGAGTWHMRGEQMASMRENWKAIPNKLNSGDFKGIDVAVLIKRSPPSILGRIKQWGGPFVYDPLDFWKQPAQAAYLDTVDKARERFQPHFDKVNADLVLTVNSAMKKDLAPIVKKTAVLYHHYDPQICPPYKRVSNKIVYWGHPRYLGKWRGIMGQAARFAGYIFEVNPPNVFDAAAMFAVRDGLHGTWLPRRWKSGIKGATAMALGVPLIAWPEESYLETCGEYLYYFTHEDMLNNQLALAMEGNYRLEPSTKYSLEKCAKNLEKILLNI